MGAATETICIYLYYQPTSQSDYRIQAPNRNDTGRTVSSVLKMKHKFKVSSWQWNHTQRRKESDHVPDNVEHDRERDEPSSTTGRFNPNLRSHMWTFRFVLHEWSSSFIGPGGLTPPGEHLKILLLSKCSKCHCHKSHCI